jgi:hypothetical protein
MTEIKDCLPAHARAHFINLRNIRLESETARYQSRLAEFRNQQAARGPLLSGATVMQQWKFAEELHDNLATGYVEDAFETCRLYDIPLTQAICECIIKAVDYLLDAQYEHALKASAQGFGDLKIPLPVRQEGNMKRIIPKVRVMVEKARVEDEKRRTSMAQEKTKAGNTYNMNIMQHGGVMSASQTGNASVQQLNIGELQEIRQAIAATRAFFKKQEESVDADEYIGLLASAEKAAHEGDESKMHGVLKQVPGKAWEIGKEVIPKVLLHYLKMHGMA